MRGYHVGALLLFGVNWFLELLLGLVVRGALLSVLCGPCLAVFAMSGLGWAIIGKDAKEAGGQVGMLAGPTQWFIWLTLLLLTSPVWWPAVWSILALLFGGGGLATRWKIGARRPSGREIQQVEAALQVVGWVRKDGRLRRLRWFVVDAPTLNGFCIGTTIYLDRGLLWSDYLSAVLGHELGHLTSLDGRLCLALNRLQLPFLRSIGERVLAGSDHLAQMGEYAAAAKQSRLGCLYSLGGGGLSIQLLAPLWGVMWRSAELAADEYAARRGLGADLSEFLEVYQPLDFAAPFLLGRTHPYTEERLDRLYQLDQQRAQASVD